MRVRVLVLLVAALTAIPAAHAVAAGFDDPASDDTSQQSSPTGHPQRDDTPNDPDYDEAEPPERSSSSLYEERYDLFGWPSALTPEALYRHPERAGSPQVSGFNAAGAWKATRGRPDVAVAVLDSGIDWSRERVRTQVRLNADELPPPRRSDGTADPSAGLDGYDLNANGAVDVDDYAGDRRVGAEAPTGRDLIRAFSDGTDDDRNGFVDDIAGWDFHDDDNDPGDSSSYFAAKNHGTGRMLEAVEPANDGQGSLGVCPRCQVIPVRIWDTFVSDANGFALGIVYASDNGASVIIGANGSLYHSAFAEAASQYAYERGVVQTYSGDDLNTANHNYPAAYEHAMLIQGTVPDTKGLGTDVAPGFPVATNAPVLSYFRGANTTQFGGKSSVSMEGATGSANTGKAGGAAALVISMARQRGLTLHPDETRALLEQTAEDVLPENTTGTGIPDPAQRGWDSHFGWGRVDLGKAVGKVRSGDIPPRAYVDGPDWYQPLVGERVTITGHAHARGEPYRWKLEWGVGQAPDRWTEVASGEGVAPRTRFGEIDLDAVRAAVGARTPHDPGGPVFSPLGPTPFDQEWTVRLTVKTPGADVPGVDRRVLVALEDETLRAGFPKRMRAGGEAPIRYADVDGDNVDDLVAPVEDGTVNVFRRDGSQLPGWPVRTRVMDQARGHRGSPGLEAIEVPAREPPRGPVIHDLDGDGDPEIVTTAGRRIYAWGSDGSRVGGFPSRVDLSLCRGEDQSQELRHRKCGFIASPAIAYLDGRDGPPWIVAPALDGHLYAFDRRGRLRPGYPVELVDPRVPEEKQMWAESINQAAVGDLDRDQRDDVVVATNESYDARPPDSENVEGGVAKTLSDLLAGAAGGSSRVYAVAGSYDGSPGAEPFLPGWPIELNGAAHDILPLIGPGHDPALFEADGEPRVVASTSGSKEIAVFDAAGDRVSSMQQDVYGPASDATDRSGQVNLFESAVVGDLLGDGGAPAIVKYGLSLGQIANLLLVSQNFPYNHLIGAYDSGSGAPLPAWPRITDDYQFLSSSTIAKVGGSARSNQVVAGTALGLLHAYDGATGLDLPGFPKVTGGWLYSPAAIAADGRMAAITREGFLFEWTTAAARCQSEWPEFRHDRQGTGNHAADGTPPGAVSDLRIERAGGRRWNVSFTSPGDDGLCGAPAGYEARSRGARVDLGEPVEAGRPVRREVRLPRSGGTLRVLARDEAGNRGIADCADRLSPVSRFKRGGRRVGPGVIRVGGRSRDRGCAGLRRVRVSVQRLLGDGRCRSLRRDGRLDRARPCRRARFLAARGLRTWTFRRRGRFAAGRYRVRVRAVDGAGNVERSNRGRNVLTVRIAGRRPATPPSFAARRPGK